MLPSAVSVLVVAQSSSEIPEGLMNNPVLSAYLVPSGKEKWNIHKQLNITDMIFCKSAITNHILGQQFEVTSNRLNIWMAFFAWGVAFPKVWQHYILKVCSVHIDDCGKNCLFECVGVVTSI